MMVVIIAERRVDHYWLMEMKRWRVEDRQRDHNWRHHHPGALDDSWAWANQRSHHCRVRDWRSMGGRGAQLGLQRGAARGGMAGRAVRGRWGAAWGDWGGGGGTGRGGRRGVGGGGGALADWKVHRFQLGVCEVAGGGGKGLHVRGVVEVCGVGEYHPIWLRGFH